VQGLHPLCAFWRGSSPWRRDDGNDGCVGETVKMVQSSDRGDCELKGSF
jgi:hypothetical protein